MKDHSRQRLAGRIELLHEVVAAGLQALEQLEASTAPTDPPSRS